MTEISKYWAHLFGLSDQANLLLISIPICVFFFSFILLPSYAVYRSISRKWLADLEVRIGPSRAGKWGILQSFADLMKSLQKESGNSEMKDEIYLGALFSVCFSLLLFLPVSSYLLIFQNEWNSFLPILGFWFILWMQFFVSSRSQKLLFQLEGLRKVAQFFSGFFPFLFSILTVLTGSSTLNWNELVAQQGFVFWHWNAFLSPFGFLAFLVFLLSGTVMLQVSVGDSIPESNLFFNQNYFGFSGTKKLIYESIKRYQFFYLVVIGVGFFLGGYALPESIVQTLRDRDENGYIALIEVGWVLFKTGSLLFVLRYFEAILPRMRVDQMTDFCWKVLSPISVFSLMGNILLKMIGTGT